MSQKLRYVFVNVLGTKWPLQEVGVPMRLSKLLWESGSGLRVSP